MPENRAVRIFISSTFRDFSAERDLLARQVFPALRAALQQRFVELVDVDLRWGITAEQAERGEVLPICLAEIDRSRPYFVGLLGERYGWTPTADAYPLALLEREPWLQQHRGGKSVTELEILHGVLNNPAMAGRALFYVRAPAYAQARGGDYLPANELERTRQTALKSLVRTSGFPLVEDYADPTVLAKRLQDDLWSILDGMFPAEQTPDAFAQVARQHEAYAAPRRRLYLGGDDHLAALDAAMAAAEPRILIEGASGGGKSALLGNWLSRWRAAHPGDLIHEHYLAATSDGGEPVSLVHRLVEAIRRVTGIEDPIATKPEELFESLPNWLAGASSHATRLGSRWIFAIDGLNGLSDLHDLRWLPAFLPDRIHLVVSCLPGRVFDALDGKGPWRRIHVEPLTPAGAEALLIRYLNQYNKTLSGEQLRLALSHPLSTNPLFLRTLAEELRVFGVYEQLSFRIRHYLQSSTVADLFGRVLERIEGDSGVKPVQRAATAIWASRSGLSENEIQGFTGLVPATWAPIRYATAEALLETGGRLTFAHDYLRQAVADRYLPNDAAQREAHRVLARWFAEQPADARAAEELPWQWQKAGEWAELRSCLLVRSIFEAINVDRTRELAGYWLDVERHTGQDLEASYVGAWARWTDDEARQPPSEERRLAWAKLARTLSQFLRMTGRYRDFTLSLAKDALDICESILGGEHIETAEVLENYSHVLGASGDDRAALPYLRRALAIREKVQGPQHAGTIAALSLVGAALRQTGDYAEAERYLRRALDLKEKNPGSEPDDGSLLNSLSVILKSKGEFRESEAMLHRALQAAERIRGREHPLTLLLMRNIANMRSELGDFQSAEPIFRQVLEAQKHVLGDRHPTTISTIGALAAVLGEMAQYEPSEELFWQTLNLQEKVLGPQHDALALTLNNFAKMLHERGQYPMAVQLAQRAVRIEEAARGAENPRTLTAMSSLATLLSMSGDEAAAERLERQVLAVRERVLGPEHHETANSLASLALRLDEKGDVDGALAMLRRCLAIEEKVLGPEHPKVQKTLENLAGILRDHGDIDESISLFRRALAIAEKVLGPEHPDTAGSLGDFAETLVKSGDTQEAEQLYHRAWQISTKSKDLERSVRYLNKLVPLLRDRGNIEEAERLFREALDATIAERGPNHIDTAAALTRLASLLIDKGDFGAIEPLARQALDIVEKAKGPDDVELVGCLDNLAIALRVRHDQEGAAALYRRRLAICEGHFSADHEQTAMSHYLLANVLNRAGQHDEAEPNYRRAFELHEQKGALTEAIAGSIAYELGAICYGQDRFAEAEPWYRRAMQSPQDDEDAAKTHFELAKVLGFRAAEAGDPAGYQEAVELMRQSLALSPRERDAAAWATTQVFLGSALSSAARLGGDAALYLEAVDAFLAALEVWPEEETVQRYLADAKAACALLQ